MPHDQPLKTKQEMLTASANKEDSIDGAANDDGADLQAMFAQVNDLPADDPLRGQGVSAAGAPPASNETAAAPPEPRSSAPPAVPKLAASLSAKVLAAFHAHGNTTSVLPTEVAQRALTLADVKIKPTEQTRADGGVVVDAGRRVAVPSFVGIGLRTAVEQAGAAGLRVQPVGSGLAREQAPAPGTMVPTGTEVVIRFSR